MSTGKLNKLETYINNFKKNHKDELEDVFTNGYCYAFAAMLHATFPKAIIMYIPIYNHFCVEYYGKLYDIKGVITDKEAIRLAEPWIRYQLYDTAATERIYRYCIMKEKA